MAHLETSRPNVLVFISHDTGRFLSPYGHDTVSTPNFERLAAMGTTFERAFCTTPLCSPARAALLTGMPPHQNGMMGLPGDQLGGWDLVRKDRHLAAVIRDYGYESVLCGFEHETQDFWSVGFERSLHGSGSAHNGGLSLRGAGAEIGRWLAGRHAASDGDGARPFYLQIGSHETHRPWTNDADPYSDRGVWKAPYLVDDPDVDAEMAEQQGAINALDDGVGEILDALEEAGELSSTILVFTTDHGLDFPRAKGTLFDPGVGVFLFLAYGDGGWKRGAVSTRLASHVDLYPTILEACGIPVPDSASGTSLIPVVTGRDMPGPAEAIYVEKTYHDNYDPMRGIRTDRFKYVVNFDAQTLYDVRIATAPRYNWFAFPFKKDAREELYDLDVDPNETKNLVGVAAYEETRAELRRRLAIWMRDTADPLLDGPIASPYHRRVSAELKRMGRDE